MNYIASLFLSMSVIVFFPGVLVNYFTQLIPQSVSYLYRFGKVNDSKNAGSIKKIEVPKRWFWHFYLWSVLFQASVVITVFKKYMTEDLSSTLLSNLVIFVAGSGQSSTVSSTATVVAVILFQIHLIRRLLETLFVAVYSGTMMNLGHYAIGYIHYTCAALALVSYSPGFTKGVGSVKDYEIFFEDFTLEQLFGIFLILYGNYQQFKAHKTFADLRKGSGQSIATMEHKIPVGGLFESISCPNYWAEIVIYVGFTFFLGFKNYTWNCCTVWVVANQVTSGVMNHKWYLEKFGDEYPKNRKAVIPYIW